MKKAIIFSIIGAVLAAAVVLLIVFGTNYAGENQKGTEGSSTEESAAAESTSETSDALNGYEEYDPSTRNQSTNLTTQYTNIVNQISDCIANDWDGNDPEAYGYSSRLADEDAELGWIRKDLDADGVDELLIGEQDGKTAKIFMIYAQTGEEGSYGLSCVYSTDEDYLTITTDNILIPASVLDPDEETEGGDTLTVEVVDVSELTEEDIAILNENGITVENGKLMKDGVEIDVKDPDSYDLGNDDAEETDASETGAYRISGGVLETAEFPSDQTAADLKLTLFN